MAIALTENYKSHLVNKGISTVEIEGKVVSREFVRKFHQDYLERRSNSDNVVVYFKNDYHFCSFRTQDIIDLVFSSEVNDLDYLVFRSICRPNEKKYSRMDVTLCVMEKGNCEIKKNLYKRGFPKWANAIAVLELLNGFNPTNHLNQFKERRESLTNSSTQGYKNEWHGVAHKIEDIKQILDHRISSEFPFFNILYALVPDNKPNDTNYDWDTENLKCRTNFMFYVSKDRFYDNKDRFYNQFIEKNGLVAYDNGTECCPPN
ncbi:hypothetical protein [uncultured Arcticibacterium sp.]|uniref:hypothetical protein n=1 Tax=uncultured Arcticibacterium sp. TaxID=2173042 RepID=UPI0030FBE36F